MGQSIRRDKKSLLVVNHKLIDFSLGPVPFLLRAFLFPGHLVCNSLPMYSFWRWMSEKWKERIFNFSIWSLFADIGSMLSRVRTTALLSGIIIVLNREDWAIFFLGIFYLFLERIWKKRGFLGGWRSFVINDDGYKIFKITSVSILFLSLQGDF